MDSDKPLVSTTVWKGKGKAVDIDFDDLNPSITYRHVLSHNHGVKDPLRVIALCDSDAFYAACEMVRLKVAEDTPLVVLQWESIIAVNYPARKYGISRMDKVKDALKRCPHLKVVHVATYKEGEKEPGYWENVDSNTHKVSLDYYRRESMKIAAMFREGLPGCEIEKASIDEAFIDFSIPVREIMLQRFPFLAEVPQDAPLGMDTPLPPPPVLVWDGLGNLIPIQTEEKESSDNVTSNQAADADVVVANNDTETSWHDVALSIGAELMGRIREDVRVKLGYSTSAGISRNKFLAKLTASYKKPNQQSILRNVAIPNYLKPMPFQKIRFLGGKLGEALAKEYEASTVGDLLTVGLDDMQHRFGEESVWVYEILRGIDRTEVKDKGSVLNKSMLASKNLPKPVTKSSDGHHWIRVLAAELALRLSGARDISPNLWPKTIVLHTRHGYESGRSRQAPFPFTRDVTVDYIATAGDKLWKELVGNRALIKITNVQLAFTGIETSEQGQQTIENFLKPPNPRKRSREEDNDDIQDNPPIQLESDFTGLGGVEVNNRTAWEDSPNSSIPWQRCPRCGFVLHGPTEISDEMEPFNQQKMAILRMEHDDFHLAQDLSKEQGSTSKIRSPLKKSTRKRNKEHTTPGIESFFKRK